MLFRSILDSVKGAGDPAQGIAKAAQAIVAQIASQAKGLPQGVVERIALPVAALVAELVVKAGIAEESPELMKGVMAALQGGQPAQPQGQPPASQGLVANAMGGA